MSKKLKKSVALVLVATFIISMFVIAPSAAENEATNPVTDTTEYSVSGNNSLGDIIADEIADYQSQKSESDGSYVISDIAMDENVATVTYSASGNCTILVAAYDENTDEMLASGRVEASANKNSVVFPLETNNMPTAFVLRGFMLGNNNEPLSDSYSTEMYTTDMQELMKKTVNDFDPEQVLNIDDNEETNFLVYSDDVKKFECTDKVNTIQTADKENDTIVFTNADERLKSLSNGDIFACDDDPQNPVIFKVGNISVDGDTVTVTAGETSLEQAFKCVKIDSEASLADAEVDESTGSSGITYAGSGKMGNDDTEEKAVNDKGSASVGASYAGDNSVGAININSDVEYEHIFNFSGNDADDGDKKKDGWFKVEGSIEGSVGISGSASVSIYLSLAGRKEVSLELSASLFYKSTVSGSIDINPTLPALKIPVAGNALSISLTAGFFITASGTFEIAFETGCKVGFSYCQGEGFNNLSQKPKTDYAMNLEGEVYVGFSLDVTAVVCDEDIGEVGYGGRIGLNISAAPTKQGINIDGVTVGHSCSRCVSGDISLKLELSPIVRLLGKDALEEVLPDFDFGSELEWELTPWHYSFTYKEFGLNLCNHVGCKFTIKVVDGGAPVGGAELNDYWPGAKNVYLGETDALGLAEITLEGNPSGMYQVNVTKGDKSAVVNFYVDNFEDILVRRGTGDWCSLSNSDNFHNGRYTVSMDKEPEPTTETVTNTVATSEPGVSASGYCGCEEYGFKNCRWSFDGSTLTISGSGSMYNGISDYKVQEDPAYEYIRGYEEFKYHYGSLVKHIVVDSGITCIGRNAFSGCVYLETVHLSDGITEIGIKSFDICSNLKSIRLPDTLISIGYGAFWGCKSLEKIKLPDSLVNIDASAFDYCEKLNLVNKEFPKSLTSIGNHAFEQCFSLEKVDLSKTNVQELGEEAFSGCISLKKVILPDQLEIIGRETFSYCVDLPEIILPAGLREIKYKAFDGCIKLTSIVIPQGVESIEGGAFLNCSNLTDVTLSRNTKVDGGVYANFPDATIHYYEDNNSVGAKKPDFTSVSAQNLSSDTNGSQITAEYSNKVANAYYIIAVVKDPNAEDVLSADNLIYINQYTADNSGKISASLSVPKDVGDNYDVVIFGAEGGTDVPDKPEKGDVNGDGKVTVDDVTTIQKYIADAVKFDDAQITVADVNNDGKVNIDDVTMIQKFIADMIPSL